jgi:hypothetical protein
LHHKLEWLHHKEVGSMGLRDDAIQAADDDPSTGKEELHDATQELAEKFAEWCGVMGIEKQPSLQINEQSYEDGVPEMQFTTMVDDIPLRGHYVRGERLVMMQGDDDREINSLADLGRAVRAEDRTAD